MSKFKCRFCGSVRRNDIRDPDYCSGKCRADDDAKVLDLPEAVQAGAAEAGVVSLPEPGEVIPFDKAKPFVVPVNGSLDDYYIRPEAYHRRLEPEKLNWGIHLDLKQLKQAGLRANRVPIPGDFDFEEAKDESSDKTE